MRQRLARLVEHPRFVTFITAVIIFNAVILGLETSRPVMEAAGPLILALDAACLAVFVVEIAMKLVALGPRFFRNGWNIFDFVIVGVSLVPAGQGFTALRALRILRVLRVVSVAPSLRRVVEGSSAPCRGWGRSFC